MKKIFYSVAMVVLGFTTSYAQKPAKRNLSAEERAEKATALMQEKLGLNNDQTQKIKQIELDRIKKMDDFRKQDESDMQKKMRERKEFSKSTKEKINTILTAEQKKQFETMKGKMKDKMEGNGPRRHRPNGNTPPPPPPVKQ